MIPIYEKTLAEFEPTDDSVVQEAFVFLADAVAVNSIEGFRSDIYPEANSSLEPVVLQRIMKVVIEWIEHHPEHPKITTAFYVLDKFRDPELVPVFRRWLRYFIKKIKPSLAPLGQMLICLEDVNEQIDLDNHSTAEAKTLAEAMSYLRGISKNAP